MNDLTDQQWLALQQAWGGCAYCGATGVVLQRDCVLPVSRGGRYTLDNAGNRTKEETVGSNGSVLRSLSRVVNQRGQIDAQLDAYENAVTYTYDAGGNVDQVTDDVGFNFEVQRGRG